MQIRLHLAISTCKIIYIWLSVEMLFLESFTFMGLDYQYSFLVQCLTHSGP